MRRMNYPRFDNPTYIGTYDFQNSNFIINDTPEPGIYFIVIKDIEASQQYSCMFTIATDTNTSCSWFSTGDNIEVYLDYSLDYGKTIIVTPNTSSGILHPVSAGSTIELYKLN